MPSSGLRSPAAASSRLPFPLKAAQWPEPVRVLVPTLVRSEARHGEVRRGEARAKEGVDFSRRGLARFPPSRSTDLFTPDRTGTWRRCDLPLRLGGGRGRTRAPSRIGIFLHSVGTFVGTSEAKKKQENLNARFGRASEVRALQKRAHIPNGRRNRHRRRARCGTLVVARTSLRQCTFIARL